MMPHYLSALREFLTRYIGIFKSVWAIRDQLDPPHRNADELAFLPAQLELIESPVSPAPGLAIKLIIALFGIALLWAIFGKLDIVAVATGKTVPSGRTKIIQPVETAVIHAIHVRDGQLVKHGDLLIELDATGTAADREKAEDALIAARLAQVRFKAMAAALDTGHFPAWVAAPDISEARQAEAARLAQSQFAAFQSKRAGLTANVAQRQAEIGTTRGMIEKLAESARIAQARSRDYQSLLEKKYVARQEYLAREQERIGLERDLAAQQNRLIELQAALSAQRDELQSLIASTRLESLDGLRQAQEQATQLSQELAKANQRDRMMQIRAPVDGTVQQLAMHTIGGVVTPAQPLMAIVPKEDALEVEALVLNKDIGFVRAGQDAVLKIETFPYTRYGYLTGVVETVSHDAQQDDKLGLVYQARVRIRQPGLVVDGTEVRLSPGMGLSVEIKTGKRRVIDYLLSPLKVNVTEALRER